MSATTRKARAWIWAIALVGSTLKIGDEIQHHDFWDAENTIKAFAVARAKQIDTSQALLEFEDWITSKKAGDEI